MTSLSSLSSSIFDGGYPTQSKYAWMVILLKYPDIHGYIQTHGQVWLKAKVKGEPLKRPLGEGYDSDASDREDNPTIEEGFILRMFPGDDCEYLRTKKIGFAKALGGADVHMKFFHEGRRAAMTIRRRPYAATLVDLPCVVEGMKSWDKRGWWKSADICQMLWVFAPIKKEEETKAIPLPEIIDRGIFQYPHGLTPPSGISQYQVQSRLRQTPSHRNPDSGTPYESIPPHWLVFSLRQTQT
jgi:TATA-binding protein-associated factor Taf7